MVIRASVVIILVSLEAFNFGWEKLQILVFMMPSNNLDKPVKKIRQKKREAGCKYVDTFTGENIQEVKAPLPPCFYPPSPL